MKIKTSELIGPALDWAVAKTEGRNPSFKIHDVEGVATVFVFMTDRKDPWYRVGAHFSTSWAQGGPIIDMENITIERNVKMRGCLVIGFYDWCATHPHNYGGLGRHHGSGTTAIIAAMRCYVASKLGDKVEVPEELLNG